MSSMLIQSEFTYRSGVSPTLYQFTIVSDQEGNLSVRDIENPYGFVISPYTTIPQSVTTDIAAAMSQVETLLALTSAVNGTVTFASEATKDITFATPLASATYRVYVSSGILAPFKVTNKTTAGFTIYAGATISGAVGYDVLV